MPSSTPKQPSGAGATRNSGREKAGNSSKKKKRGMGCFAWFVVLVLLALCIVGGVAIGWASAVLRDLPELNAERLMNPPQASTLLDRSGSIEITKVSTDQNFRTVVKFSDIPKHMRDAVVAAEDHGFYKHPGIDLGGIARMLIFGGGQGGGSTITQQLARNVFLTLDVTWERKLREMVLAIRLEQIYSKDEILHFYLNQVFFGHYANGVQAASMLYFGKDVSELTLAESAMIAAMLPSPNEYSPYVDFDLAKKMQGVTLDQMVEYGMISVAEATTAKQEELTLIGLSEVQTRSFYSSFFTDFVLRNFPALMAGVGAFGGDESLALDALYSGGLKIVTTLDMDLQAETEASIARILQNDIDLGRSIWTNTLEDGTYDRQVSAIIVEAKTGEIVTMVGGREYPKDASFVWNRAVDTLRQPGSAIKPLIDYAPALQAKVITIGTVFDDVPTDWSGWKPINFDNAYFGLIGIREALSRSQNIPAIKTLLALGPEKGIEFLKKLGFTTVDEDAANAAAAIGGMSRGVSVLDMAQAYAAIMNNGVYIHPVYIKEVRDRDDRILYTSEPRRTEVLDVQTNYLMLDLLKTVVTLPYGTGRVGNLNRPTAAKSGTTDDFRDLWFAGGTPEYASAVWIGHDSNAQMYDLYGTGIAPKIWREYMSYAVKDLPASDWTRPEGLTQATICTVSGKRPSNICPTSKLAQELFLPGTEPKPTDTCTTHVEVEVDKSNGLLAIRGVTPPSLIENRVFIRRPVPMPYPLPYGNYPADASLEAPTQYSTNTGQSGIPTTPGGTPTTPGGTPTTPSGNIAGDSTTQTNPPASQSNIGTATPSVPPPNPGATGDTGSITGGTPANPIANQPQVTSPPTKPMESQVATQPSGVTSATAADLEEEVITAAQPDEPRDGSASGNVYTPVTGGP